MARRKQPRDAKGRFVSRSRARRTTSKRKRSYKRNLPPRDSKGRFVSRGGGRRSYRRNPPKGGDIVATLTQGALDAGGILVGKAATRSIPQLLTLPQTGNTGLAVQAATAVAVGWAADRFVGPDVGRMILAGGLSAPMESLVVRFNVPWLSTALTGSGGTVGRYVTPRGGNGVRGYVPGAHRNGMNGYVAPGATRSGGRVAAYMHN